ncbi:sigma-70 family RNA polymerase sigma factor [Pseudoalteromonas arctica]|uniref:Sigma-70 family RNA polymerase sigma factor n=1 Tax=Pseudoalteromonas arctica TaxID=394751 RepID=A0A7Y0DV70_9GAMM|nr:sigma-70 family RNA polymerase sigma factor [Pseudoalteromonas arctica]
MFFQSIETLIAKAQQGNKRAWIKLVKQHESQVYNYCLRMLSNPDDAMDLMQEVFISVFKSLPSFRGESSFNTWVFQIVHRRSVEYYRRRKHFQSLDEVPELTCERSELESNQLVQVEHQQLKTMLNNLPWEQRLVVELKFFQHCTFEEIADQLDISTNTAKSRLYSALGKLKVHLEAVDG